jgi:hypothetical protein
MVTVNARWDVLRNHMPSVLIVAACPLIAWFVVSQTGELILMAAVGVVAFAVAIYVGLRHPLVLYWGLAVVLGFLPFGYVPGVHIPLYLVFTAGVLLAAVMHPGEQVRFTTLEISIVVLIFTGLVSILATGLSLTALLVFVQWAFCTLLVLALLRLSPEQLARFGRIFVYAATANSAFGIVIVAVDPNQKLIKILKPFGYGEGVGLRANTALYAPGQESQSLRLGGTWVLPNSAGFAIVIALGLCFVLFHGWLRVYLSAILLVALALTLSRSALFSLAAGVIVVLIFHSMRARDRQIAIGLIGLSVAGVMLVPSVRERILSSFGEHDAGSEARRRALSDFPGLMSGKWMFGWGWGGAEFKDGQLGQRLNPPANVPLLTIYRAGFFTGLAITVVFIVGCIVAYRLLRSNSMAHALYGGIVIGLCLVACQLDKTIVDILPITASFSILLAFLIYLNRYPPDIRHTSLHTQQQVASLSN